MTVRYVHEMAVTLNCTCVSESLILNRKTARDLVQELDPVTWKDEVGYGHFEVEHTGTRLCDDDGEPLEGILLPFADTQGLRAELCAAIRSATGTDGAELLEIEQALQQILPD